MSHTFSLNNARIATAAIFLSNGIISANWISRIPSIKERLSATPGQLGLALFGLPAEILTLRISLLSLGILSLLIVMLAKAVK